jgi:hypothetical protein
MTSTILVLLALVPPQTTLAGLDEVKANCPRLDLPSEDTGVRLQSFPTKTGGHRHVLRWGDALLTRPSASSSGPLDRPFVFGTGRYAHGWNEQIVEVTEPECTTVAGTVTVETGDALFRFWTSPSATAAERSRLLEYLGLVEARPSASHDLAAEILRSGAPVHQGQIWHRRFAVVSGPLVPQRPSYFVADGAEVTIYPGNWVGQPLRVGPFELTELVTYGPSPINLMAVWDRPKDRFGILPFHGPGVVRPLAPDAVLVREKDRDCGGTPCPPQWFVVTTGGLLSLGADDVAVRKGELFAASTDENGELVWGRNPVDWRKLLESP